MTQFDFYLNNLSFQKTEALTLSELQERIKQFVVDCEFIRQQDNERIFRHYSIYDELIFDNCTVSDFCHTPLGIELTDRDSQVYLQQIIDHAKDTNLENEDIIELLDEHDEELINGILCLHKKQNINEIYCVYHKNDWYKFHRYFLCVYPPVRNEFCKALSPYFPNLYFNETSIPAGLNGLHTDYTEIMQTIIHHLSALNDVFFDIFMQEGMSGDKACDELENHYRSHQVKIGASRDKNGLDELYFGFPDSDKKLYCDLHTKFYQYFEDSNPSHQTKGNRIYFHQPIKDYKNGKILIARIGKHAN